jgi:uncharacterized membrane protein
MGIGFRELLVLVSILLVLLVVAWLFIASIIWFAKRRSRDSAVPEYRSVSARLAEIESLRRAGQISDDEYERQRASIIASV